MTSAAIYARVSSKRQAKDQTIGSQTQALRAHAAASRLEVPEDWVLEDEGHSGATLVRPALEALRDLACSGRILGRRFDLGLWDRHDRHPCVWRWLTGCW
jgi:DNA invertase Pin-like site-specific DNA recombinase